jgi:DNA helicase-2/ATP-dependent DNA helicase PcrA
MEQEEVQALLGAILAIVDPNRRYATANAYMVPRIEPEFRSECDRLMTAHSELRNYIAQARAAILAKPGQALDCNLQELAYYLMSREPFTNWQADPERRSRLAKLTKLLEAYSATPVLDPATGLPRAGATRGFLKISAHNPGEIYEAWLGSFYHLFLTYIVDAGINDEEDDDVICPSGQVSVMTMHQSKGLEFPFVFVGHMAENAEVSSSHELETLFSAHPANPARSFPQRPAAERAEMDMIRQYYVAYSRAEYALIFLGLKSHFSKHAVPCGPTRGWLKHKTQPL